MLNIINIIIIIIKLRSVKFSNMHTICKILEEYLSFELRGNQYLEHERLSLLDFCFLYEQDGKRNLLYTAHRTHTEHIISMFAVCTLYILHCVYSLECTVQTAMYTLYAVPKSKMYMLQFRGNRKIQMGQ